MDVMSTVVLSVVVAAVGGLLAWFTHGQFAALTRRIDRLEDRMDARFTAVDARFAAVDGRFAAVDARLNAVQGSIEALRTDVTRLALGEARPQPGTA